MSGRNATSAKHGPWVRRSAAENRKRLIDAFFDWTAIASDPPLPELPYEAAVDWAYYAWQLRHEAKRELIQVDASCQDIIFAPDYWQRMYREKKAVEDILKIAKRPLSKIRIVAGQPAGWFMKSSQEPDVVIVAEEDTDLYLPEGIGQILGDRITDERELLAVVQYLQEREARYKLRIHELQMLAIGHVYQRGLQDGRPHVPCRSGPRADKYTEKRLHLYAMVEYLKSRGFTQMKACVAIGEALDGSCSPETITRDVRRAKKYVQERLLPTP